MSDRDFLSVQTIQQELDNIKNWIIRKYHMHFNRIRKDSFNSLKWRILQILDHGD